MNFRTPHPLLSLLTLALFSLPAQADFITGRVVDSFGVGVPGVDIDVKNLGSGGTPPIFNDGTDALGNFVTTVPAGLYRVSFTPPIPPLSSHLVTEVEDVIIVGTKNMGTITLPPGVLISGLIRDPAGFPLAGVNLDVIDLTTGDNLILPGDLSNAFGEFTIAAPASAIELRLNPSGVLGQTLAPTAFLLQPTEALSVGTVSLKPGFRISGIVVGPGMIPFEDADFDISMAGSGVELYTPDDNTDVNGAFSIVVPAGHFRAALCPVNGEQLVGQVINDISVTADVSLGLLQMEAGFLLSGVVRAFDGSPVAGADVDVDRPGGAPVHLCADSSDAIGAYSVVVPAGILDVEFDPPGFSLPLGRQSIPAVSVVGNTPLDASLPSCPLGISSGTGSPGTGGIVPGLTPIGGAPRAGNSAYGLEVTGALGGSTSVLSLSFPSSSSARFPFKPKVFIPLSPLPGGFRTKTQTLSGALGVAGVGSTVYSMPVDQSMVGISITAQAWVFDPNGVGSIARTNFLAVNFCE